MASPFIMFHTFPQDFLTGLHNFEADEFHIALTNVRPDVTTDVDFTSIVEVAAGHGYPMGGLPVTLNLNLGEDGVTTVAGTNVVFTATGGDVGPFRYAVLFNYSQDDQRLVAYYEHSGSISLGDSETFTVLFDLNGVFRVTG